jgi:hypothetical protein
MIRDPFVEEVRAIREQLAAPFDFDIRKIVKDAQKRQAASQARVVSFQRPNPSLSPTGAALPVFETSTVPEAAPGGRALRIRCNEVARLVSPESAPGGLIA